MTSPRLTCDPSLTASEARRPGIFAETAAFVRATTYPFATTPTVPIPPVPLPDPGAPSDTVTTWTGTGLPPRSQITSPATTTIAAAASHSVRVNARFTAGGG